MKSYNYIEMHVQKVIDVTSREFGKFPHFRHGQCVNMNLFTNVELSDIHFNYSLANGNYVILFGCKGESIQRDGKKINKRFLGCIGN